MLIVRNSTSCVAKAENPMIKVLVSIEFKPKDPSSVVETAAARINILCRSIYYTGISTAAANNTQKYKSQ